MIFIDYLKTGKNDLGQKGSRLTNTKLKRTQIHHGGSRGLEVTVLASNANGPGFEPGPALAFSPLIITPDLRVGKIQHLVFSDKDEKSRRSRVHVAHVKEPLAVENRKE